MPIKVLVADDSQSIRNSIASVLGTCKDIELVGQSDSFNQTVKCIRRFRPQVVVLDLHMPDQKRIDLIGLKPLLGQCALVIVSVWNDAETQELAAAIGADAFLDKAALGTDLIPKILSLGSRKHISA